MEKQLHRKRQSPCKYGQDGSRVEKRRVFSIQAPRQHHVLFPKKYLRRVAEKIREDARKDQEHQEWAEISVDCRNFPGCHLDEEGGDEASHSQAMHVDPPLILLPQLQATPAPTYTQEGADERNEPENAQSSRGPDEEGWRSWNESS